jgi:anti-sigma factor ChrR (cupin superfamily)
MPDAARLLLPRLLAGGWRDLSFVPFRAGIDIHRIYGDGIAGPATAVLRYRPGGSVPWHEHEGFEHVVVLEGSQEDERGVYPAGTLAINPQGSRHSVQSRGGCVALLIWERPVRFLAPASQA